MIKHLDCGDLHRFSVPLSVSEPASESVGSVWYRYPIHVECGDPAPLLLSEPASERVEHASYLEPLRGTRLWATVYQGRPLRGQPFALPLSPFGAELRTANRHLRKARMSSLRSSDFGAYLQTANRQPLTANRRRRP
jgi:hypothetical protein